MAASPDVYHHRAKVGALARAVRNGERPKSDLDDARRDLAITKLAEHAEQVVSSWPPPTPEQLRRVAAILNAGGSE